jgi:hypothetical protein
MLAGLTDAPPPGELEQIARSLAMSSSLGRLAEIDATP